MAKKSSTLTVKNSQALTPAEFYQLQDVPPVIEWFANIDNKNTRASYERVVREFMEFTGIKNPDEFRSVTRAHIIAFRKQCEKRELSPATIRLKLAALSALFNHLCDCNAVMINPVLGVKRPKVENPNEGKTPILSDEEVRRLLVAPASDTVKGKRDRAILSTLLFHGLRREELVGLTVNDLHSRNGLPHFRVKGKGGRIRNLPIAPTTLQAIQDYLEVAPVAHRKRALFRPVKNNRSGSLESAISPYAIYHNIVKYYAKVAGLNADNVCVHSTRATAATNALENKSDIKDVQPWLGHANISTTKLYIRTEARAEDSPSFRVNYKT